MTSEVFFAEREKQLVEFLSWWKQHKDGVLSLDEIIAKTKEQSDNSVVRDYGYDWGEEEIVVVSYDGMKDFLYDLIPECIEDAENGRYGRDSLMGSNSFVRTLFGDVIDHIGGERYEAHIRKSGLIAC